MSFLAGRLAGKEGAYFFQESKHAVGRLLQKNPTQASAAAAAASASAEQVPQTDVLPEILRHSLPSKIFSPTSSDSSTLAAGSKWVLPSDPKSANSISPDALNPLRAFVSLPQVTFGPRRWELPQTENSVLASTANELRRDKGTHVNPEKLKAAAEGLAQVGKAFAVATAVIFGGATLLFGLVVAKYELHNSDDIRTKGRDLVQQKSDMFREQLIPLRTWAENTSKKWHLEREESIKDKPMIKELSRMLGAKTSN